VNIPENIKDGVILVDYLLKMMNLYSNILNAVIIDITINIVKNGIVLIVKIKTMEI